VELDQSEVFMSLINTASALKDEIDKVVLYWQSYITKRGHASDRSVSRLVISGRDAEINGLREYLVATIKLPVITADVWTNIYDIERHIPEIPYIDSLDYAVAIGLGLPKIE
jgi:Tfp pilus assembly PilM family ATPase